MTENPVPAFPVPRLENYRPYVFSIDELRRFFDYLQQQADHSGNPFTSFRFRSRYVFYHLLYACGLRVSEGVRLTTADYSAEQRTLFIQPSKFHKDRLIPIGSRAASNLSPCSNCANACSGFLPRAGFSFSSPSADPIPRLRPAGIFKRQCGIWESIAPRSLIVTAPTARLILHELRRAFAVHRLMRWYREQVDVDAKLPLLATYMGHGRFEYTKTYLTLTRQLLSEAGHRFARSFDRLDWMPHDPEL